MAWVGDTSFCISVAFNGGYSYIYDTDQPNWYERTMKLYVNGSLFTTRTFADGESSGSFYKYRINGEAGTSYSITEELYGPNGQLSQSLTWSGDFPVTIGDTSAIDYTANENSSSC